MTAGDVSKFRANGDSLFVSLVLSTMPIFQNIHLRHVYWKRFSVLKMHLKHRLNSILSLHKASHAIYRQHAPSIWQRY